MFNTINCVWALAAALLLTGCQTYTPEQIAFIQDLGSRPITCQGKDACDVLWSKATTWVVTHRLTVQTQSDTLITTLPDYLSGFAITIQRVAMGSDEWRIDLRGDCITMPFCNYPSETEVKAQFYRCVTLPSCNTPPPEFEARARPISTMR